MSELESPKLNNALNLHSTLALELESPRLNKPTRRRAISSGLMIVKREYEF